MVLFCLKSLSYLVAHDKDLCFLRCIFSQEYDVWPIFWKIFTHLFCHTMNLSSQRNQQESYNEITNLWILMCCSFVFGVRINQNQLDRMKGKHEIHEKNMIVIIRVLSSANNVICPQTTKGVTQRVCIICRKWMSPHKLSLFCNLSVSS